MLLFGSGLAGLAGIIRKKRRAKSVTSRSDTLIPGGVTGDGNALLRLYVDTDHGSI